MLDETHPRSTVATASTDARSWIAGGVVPRCRAAAHSIDTSDRGYDGPTLRHPRPYLRWGLAQSHLDTQVLLLRKRSALRPVHSRRWLGRRVGDRRITQSFPDCPHHPAQGGGCEDRRGAAPLSAQP